MLFKIKIVILPLFIMFFGSCNQTQPENSEDIMASVNGKYLKAADLNSIMPVYPLSEEDSAQFVETYIKDWIKQQLLVAEAKKVLSDEEQDVSKELEQYKQQLLIHKYKNKKVNSVNVSGITEDSIAAYYEANIEKFLLAFPIVKVKYIVFPLEMDIPQNISNAFKSSPPFPEDVNDYIFSYATNYDDFNNQWIYFKNLFQNTKYAHENVVDLLEQNKIIDFENNNEKHIIIIEDYRLTGEQSPLDFVKDRIRNMLINNKKIDFLREIKDSLYNHALKYNNFKASNQ
ncbi:MAG: hypothetical protein PF486_08540 [Prolixibacteraceae bacterium]|jgi:hypothetical protein|nr:hypothetical protein [Prolixibacteraceae bacterium]